MVNPIVVINASTVSPPAPSKLLKSAAFVSSGGTLANANTLTLCRSKTDIANAQGIVSLGFPSGSGALTPQYAYGGGSTPSTLTIWLTGITSSSPLPANWPAWLPTSTTGQVSINATVTLSGLNYSNSGSVTINGVPLQATGFQFDSSNGNKAAVTITIPASTPSLGTMSSATNTATATFSPPSAVSLAEIQQMGNSWFNQGAGTPVYILELGYQSTAAAQVTQLNSWLTANPNLIWGFVVPRAWDTEPTFKTLAAAYTNPNVMTYFFVTTTITTYATAGWSTCGYKSVHAQVESPTIAQPSNPALGEFDAAAALYGLVSMNPGPAAPAQPLEYRYQYGQTIWPGFVNGTSYQTTQANLKSANISYVGSSAEGGLSNAILVGAKTLDGNPINYWYNVDWVIVNVDLDTANEVINGSNNSIAPLLYNQDGINRLQNRAAKTLRIGTQSGIILGNVVKTSLDPTVFAANVANGVYAGQCVINAVPFALYNSLYPSDYSLGLYQGLQVAFTPARGFDQIIYNVLVTNFAG